jgi:hypothetical protein
MLWQQGIHFTNPVLDDTARKSNKLLYIAHIQSRLVVMCQLSALNHVFIPFSGRCHCKNALGGLIVARYYAFISIVSAIGDCGLNFQDRGVQQRG